MSERGRAFFRIIVAIIWIAGGVICGISGQIIAPLLFLAVGTLFMMSGIMTIKNGE